MVCKNAAYQIRQWYAKPVQWFIQVTDLEQPCFFCKDVYKYELDVHILLTKLGNGMQRCSTCNTCEVVHLGH